MKNNKEEDFVDRKQNRRKKMQNKNVKKHPFDEEDSLASKKNKLNIREKKENLENEEWEDWDRYYNH